MQTVNRIMESCNLSESDARQEFVSAYKGFKIEQTANGFILWGKKLFEPLDTIYAKEKTLAGCKRMARVFLSLYNLKTWPVLFADRIVKH